MGPTMCGSDMVLMRMRIRMGARIGCTTTSDPTPTYVLCVRGRFAEPPPVTPLPWSFGQKLG